MAFCAVKTDADVDITTHAVVQCVNLQRPGFLQQLVIICDSSDVSKLISNKR